MKKLLTLLLTAALATTAATTAFAADNNKHITPNTTADADKTTQVTYTVNPSYTVTIPGTVTLGEKATVSAKDVKIANGKTLIVKLTGTSEKDNAFKVKTTEGAELTYTVQKKDGANISVGSEVLSATSGQAPSAELSFIAPKSTTFAGEYKGTVTFTVSVG